MKKLLGGILLCMLFVNTACSHGDNEQGVRFVEPQDGAIVQSDMNVLMAVQGMTIQKAGDLKEGTGHFHIIIDGGFVPSGEVVAKDKTHLHFGKGQMQTRLHLEKGKHTLTLQLADGHHVSYGEPWSQTIHITVQ